jgi:hypothetical protein
MCAECFHRRLDPIGKRRLNFGTLARGIRRECSEHRVVRRLFDTIERERLHDVRLPSGRASISQSLDEPCVRAREHVRASLRSQRIFRSEVVVKTAVRKAGGVHQFSDTHAIDAVLAKQSRRSVENTSTIFSRSFFLQSHGASLPRSRACS